MAFDQPRQQRLWRKQCRPTYLLLVASTSRGGHLHTIADVHNKRHNFDPDKVNFNNHHHNIDVDDEHHSNIDVDNEDICATRVSVFVLFLRAASE
jgi:hypothetical protein